MKTKVFLIEKSPIVTAGFCQMLQENAQFDVDATADTMDRIAERLVVVKPDIVVLNPQLIDNSKLFTFRALFQDLPNVPIIALVYNYFDSQVLKHFDGVIEIDDNLSKITGKLSEALESASGHSESPDIYDLSDRERAVLIKLAKGMTNKAIATDMHLSVHTIITHRKNIVRKTGIKSIAGLTVYAMLNNLIEE